MFVEVDIACSAGHARCASFLNSGALRSVPNGTGGCAAAGRGGGGRVSRGGCNHVREVRRCSGSGGGASQAKVGVGFIRDEVVEALLMRVEVVLQEGARGVMPYRKAGTGRE